MVVIRKEFVNSIPVLEVVQEKKLAEKLPLAIFAHGFTSAKENNLHIAYLLAERGFRAVLPDAPYHGERDEGFGEVELSVRFWDIVIKTIHEVNTVKDFYVAGGLAASGEIGLAGTSMGGIVTLGALTQYDWIGAAVSLMGSPSYREMAGWQVDELRKRGHQLPISDEDLAGRIEALGVYDLSLQPEKVGGRPLLFWHGEADTVVPHHYAWEFYEKQLKDQQRNGDIAFISERHAGHKVTRKGTYALVDWFVSHLGSGRESAAERKAAVEL
ncbi:esterase [Neobacillus piezotolerans]|uniref:Esterase n=1 Tax=Neobacillus piezotolerans TaxID=2259171 RepID=A0A3D8GMR1_9BACI|nr:prolyl oligopeptidase family serine peptidase [Neobacillus piezotolerans]RDU35552.1 esterase [Neobacillus piezotolerans]